MLLVEVILKVLYGFLDLDFSRVFFDNGQPVFVIFLDNFFVSLIIPIFFFIEGRTDS